MHGPKPCEGTARAPHRISNEFVDRLHLRGTRCHGMHDKVADPLFFSYFQQCFRRAVIQTAGRDPVVKTVDGFHRLMCDLAWIYMTVTVNDYGMFTAKTHYAVSMLASC